MGENTKKDYGVIAYIPGRGAPQDDEAHFDGWYSIREWAEEVFRMFVRDYPGALVHLVTREGSEWRQEGGATCSTVRQKARESE
jgi:hypothetical protein